jgi:probable rRNA maturation factor
MKKVKPIAAETSRPVLESSKKIPQTPRSESFIRIANLQNRRKLALPRIKRLTKQVLRALKEPAELHLTFVSDPQIRKINNAFHARNQVTDVLAFSAPHGWQEQIRRAQFLGEIIVSVDRVLQNAKRFGVLPSEELMRYVVHGALHLLGETDHTTRMRQKMFRRQERLIQALRPIGRLIH